MKTIRERREFLKTLGADAAALTMSPLAGCGRKPPRQPNNIIILTDPSLPIFSKQCLKGKIGKLHRLEKSGPVSN
jgi:hypothetical protein